MSIYLFSILFNAVVAYVLGFFSLRKKGGGDVYRNFYYLLSLVSLIYFTLFAMQFSYQTSATMFLAQILMVWMILLPLIILRTVLIFAGKHRSHKKQCYFLAVVTFGFLVANYFNIFIDSVGPRPYFNSWPSASTYFEYFNIYFFSLLVYSLFILFSKYSRSQASVKESIKYTIFAILVFYISQITDYYFWYGVNIPPIGNFVLNSLFVLVFYFFLSKRIIDFQLAIRKSTVTLSSLLLMFAIVIFLKYFLAIFLPEVLVWDDYALLILAIFIYPLIKNRLFRFANRYFFTSLYDPGKVITKFNKSLRSIIEIDEIYALLDKTFSRTFHSGAFGVLFYGYDNKKYSIKYNTGFNIYSDVEFESDSMLFRKYIEKDKIIVMSDLLKDIQFRERKMTQIFKHFKIELVIPLVIKDRVLGVIVLSAKKSGDSYNNEDIGVLNVISSQATVAIDNALKYEEIKKFKFKLQREVKKATQELRVVNSELKRVDADKSGFISIASHQLRTPLTVIKGYSSMILEGNFGGLKDVTKDAMSKVFISSERLIELVEDLLDISRIESGKQSYEFKSGQLEDLIDSMIDSLAMSAEEKKVDLVWNMPKKPLSPIKLDKEKLRQSCMNLIENAIKYTSKAGREHACVKVDISEDKENKRITVKIKDNGLGISKEDMANLFTKFYRGKDKAIATIEGTGLGLYIAKQIIVKHDGDVTVKSAGEGKGAEFTFWVPTWVSNKNIN
jgi:signal transduction histidine kinase